MFLGLSHFSRKEPNMCKITIIEFENSRIKNYTQLFKFGFKI